MVRADGSAAVSVERFFQFSLLGLVASGYLAVAGSGYLDAPTVLLTAAGLFLRGLLIYGLVRFEISERAATIATVAYSAFYVADYLALSRGFLQATVHLVFFLAVVKILTAHSNRDHLYTAVIAFLELVAAAILSINFNFFVFLTVYLLFAMAALTSGEIRRSMHKAGAATTARTGLRRFHSRLGLLSAGITGGILALTAGLFFVLPRTADAAFSRLISHRMHLPGFSNQVSLGEIGEIKSSSRPVMHIHIWGELAGGLKWRGGALMDFDGKRWSNPSLLGEPIRVTQGEVELAAGGEQRAAGRRINYDVNYEEISTDALFFAGTPESVRLRVPGLFRVEGDAYRLGHGPPPGFHYEAYSLLEEVPERAAPRFPAPILPLQIRERYLRLPQLDARIAPLARNMAGPGTDLERARSVERHLRREYGYTLQLPERELDDPLANFLFTRRKGHCEYFASALTVMLRTLGIPARLATGFQSGIYNSLTGLWLVRASDAHTWVEAWMPGYGWTTFDPTPPDPNPSTFALFTRFGLYLDAAETFWQQWIVGYDPAQQGTLADRMEQGARRMGINWLDSLTGFGTGWNEAAMRWVRRFGLKVAIIVAMGVWIWVLGPPLFRLVRMRRRVERVRRGQASVADATLLYQRMLEIVKRSGYQKPPWFTPAEFAASLAGSPLGTAVGEFTATYNALRFGGHTEVAHRLSALLDELEHART
jgi:transglutaminase-like putative cysteine protease